MQILLTSVSVSAALLYLAAWSLGLRRTRRSVESAIDAGTVTAPHGAPAHSVRSVFSNRPGLGTLASTLLLLALLAHFVALYLAIAPGSHVRFGFAHIVSAALWVGSLMLWFEPDDAHASAMRALVLPVTALAAPLPALFPGAVIAAAATGRALFVPHLLVGTLAYAVLFIALLHAVVMASAERRLRAAPSSGGLVARLIDRLPPLLSMERVLFRLVMFGFLLLTLTTLSGMFWSERIFARPFQLDHKTVFTLLAWAVFGMLLLGRRLWGWRGRTALRLTIAGFVVMLLGYVGSRFVLEVVIGLG